MFWPKSWSATHLATFFGLNRIVDSLLEAELQRGANLAEERMYHYQALVAIASARGHASTLRMLLDLHCPREGSFLEAQVILPGLDETRATPLCLAAKNGHTGVSALLLKRGAAPDTPDDSGRTPLSLAAANGHVKVGALLIDHGAKLDGQDVSGRTPLIWAAEEVHEDVVKLLLEAGCKPQIKDDKGMSALSYAAKNGHRGIVEALIKCGAPLEDRDVWGRRPSEQARHSGHLAIAGILEAAEKERVE
ncbi:Ankyrin repeat domain-containing protein 50 [Colletotrichum orbiculare MAFF 240422]|uniref:Ankyrin repeat domain-containing protein 50 n=1 Tax=Colletotrichum orbiculare (strain 104-T / ATCC 96160 / CBS 514.97 / LARS 414 / MAFF 240422) TaxID=1213857 RepID=N4V3D4_COLOR|nr:Ankyrin repeat domain-containing protein 50 [Colletotrichum orbiculare MAFF 240422]